MAKKAKPGKKAGEKKIIVTGGAGFIGANIIKGLNKRGLSNIVVVDELGKDEKWKNLAGLSYYDFISKEKFIESPESFCKNCSAIIHMGACSDTMELDSGYLMENNFSYSKKLFDFCLKKKIRLIYASSAAVYGNGSLGYDDYTDISSLRPLNMYGYTKKLFDSYAKKMISEIWNKSYEQLSGKLKGFQCTGLRFFNVFGPMESHKKRMASVAFHAFGQIKETGTARLFKSYKKGIRHGEQKRDFIYVKDVVDVVLFFLETGISGIFNVGTGKAESFNSLIKAVFKGIGKKPSIKYIEMPEQLKGKYQYFTEAKIEKLRKAGYKKPFHSLENAVKSYMDFLKSGMDL